MTEFIESADLWLSGVIAMILLILSSGFFSGSETSFFYLSHDEIRSLRVGKQRERIVAALLSDPDRLLTAILFWNLVINLLYFSVSIVVTQRLTSNNLNVAAGVFSIFSLFGLILCGEVIPKSIAVFACRKVAVTASWPLAIATRVLDPIIPTLSWITKLARRTLWPNVKKEAALRPEDLERAVDAFQLSEEIIEAEQQVLHNILDLSEIKVEEVMRPRGTYQSVTTPIQLDALSGQAPAGDFVVVKNPDRTTEASRVISLANFTSITPENMEAAADDLIYVPWCADLASTLQMLQENYSSVAAVVNEYGETVGMVTYEDLLDTILMPQPSRTRRLLKRDPIIEVSDGKYQVEGITTLRHFCARFDLEYLNNTDGQLTISGMMSEQLDRVPQLNDQTTWRGYQFTVTDVSKVGKFRLMVTKI